MKIIIQQPAGKPKKAVEKPPVKARTFEEYFNVTMDECPDNRTKPEMVKAFQTWLDTGKSILPELKDDDSLYYKSVGLPF